MLPDVPIVKRELLNAQLSFVQAVEQESMKAFNECPRTHIYEGDAYGVRRKNENEDVDPLYKISGEAVSEPSKDDLESTFAKLYPMAVDMGRQNIEQTIKYLSENIPDSQSVNVRGRSMGADVLIDVLRTAVIPLDEHGELDLSGFKFTNANGDGIPLLKMFELVKMSAEQAKQINDILLKQKEQQLAREANRELVG